MGAFHPVVHPGDEVSQFDKKIILPKPDLCGKIPLETVLHRRRSIRDYSNHSLPLTSISQLLWSSQGITESAEMRRTTPSAGALYPLEIYVAVGKVEGVPTGGYHYRCGHHELVRLIERDVRSELSRAALGQAWIVRAPVVFVISAVYDRVTRRYGKRGIRYVHMEAGHAAQNIYLQAVALNLGTVAVGAFHDAEVQKIFQMTAEETPLYIMPIGVPLFGAGGVR